MKVNKLLSDVLRGEWLMEPTHLLGYGPIVQKILSGEEITFDDQAASLFKVIDPKGRQVKPDDEGQLHVPPGSVAVVSMVGSVIKYGDFCTYGSDEIVRALRQAESHKNIKGTIFNIDGPGGAVSAIGPFLQFAKTKKKPVVGIADAAMSLHYWAAVAVCDHLLADNDVSARFGSVGVVSSFMDSKPHWEEKGYKFHEIYPEESTHKNEAFRLALQGKYDMIKKEHLSPIAQKFQAAVRANRPNLKEDTGVLTGKTFAADAALDLGMIDGIGDINEARDMLNALAVKQELKSIF